MLQWGEIKRRLGTLDVSSLADADKQLRVLDAAVKPLNPGLKLIGRAYREMPRGLPGGHYGHS